MRYLLLLALIILGVASPAQAAASGLAGSYCGDGADHADITNAPKIKVIYAYASDQPNRLPQVGGEIQESLRQGAQAILDASGGQKSLRLDRNPVCGLQYIDIRATKLPGTLVSYQALSSNAARLNAVREDLAAMGLAPSSPDNTLVLFDRLATESFGGGIADAPKDARPGPDNRTNQGGMLALVFGAPASSTSGFFDPGSWPSTGHLPLHELFHNLGAVHPEAPNYINGGHCRDGNDLMCTHQGDPPRCGWEPGWDMRLDCGGDDYFSASPAPGSWLSSHWNLFNSWFLCPQASCGTPEAAPPVQLSYEVNGTTATLDAQATGVSRFFWDLDGQPGYELDGAGRSSVRVEIPPGGRTFGVRAVATGGAFAEAWAGFSGAADPSGPSGPGGGIDIGDLAVSCTPQSVQVGRQVSCTASGKLAEQATTVTWNWGDGESSSGRSASHTYARSGLFFINLSAHGPAGSSQRSTLMQVQPSALAVRAKGAKRPAVLKGALRVKVTGARANETLRAVFGYGKATQRSSVKAGRDGSAAFTLRPRGAMRKALRRPGKMQVSVTSASGQGRTTVRVR